MKQASDATQAADQGQSRTRGRHIHRKGQLMTTSFQLQSTVRASGQLEITLQSVPPPEPGEDDVLISVEATPINPSDLGLLFAGADLSQARNIQRDGATLLSAPIEPAQLAKLGARLDKPLPVGNEGAGKVIRAGVRTVSLRSGSKLSGPSGGRHGTRRRIVLREPAHRARHGGNNETRWAQRNSAYRSSLQPRPDVEQAL
jgi:threonine dehydrogenase-like Zn-dependent dehydrogenase